MRGFIQAIIVLVIGAPYVVHPLFMDMYGKVFQADLLDDCTVYVYDRVVDLQGPKHWCLTKKSNIDASVAGKNTTSAIIYGFFIDEGKILNVMTIATQNESVSRYQMVSQDYFETSPGNYTNVNTNTNINHTQTSYGTYRDLTDNMINSYGAAYLSCTGDVNITRYVYYNFATNTAKVSAYDKTCDPNIYKKTINGQNTEVRINPQHPDERICSVGNLTFILHPINSSIQTTVFGYNMFKNISESFLFSYYATDTPHPATDFSGVIIRNGKLFSSGGKQLLRPQIENYYTEVPFFFLGKHENSYSPLFLYYKYAGQQRDFTIRFVYNKRYYLIFDPVKYMDRCGFEDAKVTVTAAPKILQHDEKSISLEVYFLQNNADLKYCIIEITYHYATQNYTIRLENTSAINAYVHVKTRSKTAVNCIYGNSTVRWLLAYTEGKEAELVSLDNDVSSPIFPCPSCGPSTMMYCNVHPESAKKYHSAVYLITGEEIHFVGVKRKGYMLQIEYYFSTMQDEQYFAQELDFTVFLDEIYKLIVTGTSEPPSGVDLVAGNQGACDLRRLWMTSLSLVTLMCTFLTGLN